MMTSDLTVFDLAVVGILFKEKEEGKIIMLDLSAIWPEWTAIAELGEGAYGSVYKCVREERGIRSECAVKVITIPQSKADADGLILDGLSAEASRSYFSEIVDDFANEIRVMEELKGAPGIVSIEDYKIVERTDHIGWDIYIRMELLTPFREYAQTNIVTQQDIVSMALNVCEAMEICAKRNILHRDIKPENIFVDRYGKFKIGDFGVAKQIEKTMGASTKKGTYSYMAPEVYLGQRYDIRADIYSLGMVMYRLLNNNRDPFVDPTAQMVSYRQRTDAMQRRFDGEQLPAPAQADENLAKIILRCCAFNPKVRYENFTELENDLKETWIEVLTEPTAKARIEKTRVPKPKKEKKEKEPKQKDAVSDNADASSKRRVRKILIATVALMLVVATAIGVVFAVHFKHKPEVDGRESGNTCGDGLSWMFDQKTGTLTISGFGEMQDFWAEDISAPWGSFSESIKYVIIKNGVASIGGDAFRNCAISEITIPGSVKTIGNCAFTDCGELKQVIIKEGCTTIGANAFLSCGVLTDVRIPDSLTRIEEDAFYGCESLKSISIPAGVEEIGPRAFALCAALKTIDVSTDNPYYTANDGILYSKDMTTLVMYSAGNTRNSYRVPDGVTEILPHAFYYLPATESVSISDSVTKIGEVAFAYCESLSKITIGKGVETIGDDAFDECYNLREIVVSDDNPFLKSVDGILFSKDMTELINYPSADQRESYSIPRGVKTIRQDAFEGCKRLRSLTISDSVTFIDTYAFYECNGIASITIPNSVETTGWGIFNGWTPSQTIYMQGMASAPSGWENEESGWDYGCEAKIVWNAEAPIVAAALDKPLQPYADGLRTENKTYKVALEADNWNINKRSSPEVSSNNITGTLKSGTKVYVLYIYNDLWAVCKDDSGEYYFLSLYAKNDPSQDTILDPVE